MTRRSFRWPHILVVLVAGLAGFAVGIAATVELSAPSHIYARFSYHTRDTLGLQKNWAPLPGPEQADGRQERACPAPDEAVALIIGGQSNAANNLSATHDAGPDVSVWFDGRCFAATDPLLGAFGKGGSIWSLLGDRIAAELNQPVLLILAPVSGTQFGDWLDPRSGYYAALTERVASARAAGYQPDMMLWHHGETDAAANRDMARLEKEAGALLDRMSADIPDTPIYFFQATRCSGGERVNGIPAVIEVLRKVADARPNVITGMNTDVLGSDYRWDRCHFNSLGRDAIIAEILPDLVSRLGSDN